VYIFVITAEVRRRQENYPGVHQLSETQFFLTGIILAKTRERKTSMNLAYFFTLLFLAIAGSAYMTYFEHERSRRHSKKKRKNKMKVA